MTIKQQLYKQCVAFVEDRLETIRNTIVEIQESLTTETKSSAGDKHETGRAMLQLEREKTGVQLAEINKVKEALFKIENKKEAGIISLGSVVYTTQSNYYIAISAGELQTENQRFYAISPSTPIGKLLIGKKLGQDFVFRGTKIVIEKIS